MSASKTRSRGAKGGRGGKSQSGKGQGGNRSGGAGQGKPDSAAGGAGPSPAAAPSSTGVAMPGDGSRGSAEAPPASASLAAAKAKTSTGAPPRTSRAVVRHIDPRSALRVSALFYLSISLALFVAGGLLWAAANALGLVANVESFMDEIGFTDFQLRAGQFLKASLVAGVALTVCGSVANLLMAMLYNLISDTFGGIKVVLGEDKADPTG